MNTFTVKNLSAYYGDFQALKNIDMEIEKNKITALIGPSGCGKSTFLKCFNRMNDLVDSFSHEGEILFNGVDIYDESVDVVQLRTNIGMVFQHPNPFPMSIFDNVAYGLRVQGIKDKKVLNKRVKNSLKRAALYSEVKDRLKKSALKLSGGQQQRVCIARAIALTPKVILMDEPTSALDPVATAKIEELMINLKKEYTIIIVTHSMQQAARISDNTAFFLAGELIEIGETSEVFYAPKDQRTENYISGRFA
ncbi:MAG: phosphate ABC transporter ATP-binding protein [Clostridium sp.]|nr:phosphate ABC transporter ATP-binding protein [Clostridium sp.]